MADGNSLEQQAQSGNMDAQFQLGVQYLYGTNVDKDTSKAAEWFTKAAAQGHVPAIRELGILIASGDGVDPDPEKGAELLGRASDELDPSANLEVQKYISDSFAHRGYHHDKLWSSQR